MTKIEEGAAGAENGARTPAEASGEAHGAAAEGSSEAIQAESEVKLRRGHSLKRAISAQNVPDRADEGAFAEQIQALLDNSTAAWARFEELANDVPPPTPFCTARVGQGKKTSHCRGEWELEALKPVDVATKTARANGAWKCKTCGARVHHRALVGEELAAMLDAVGDIGPGDEVGHGDDLTAALVAVSDNVLVLDMPEEIVANQEQAVAALDAEMDKLEERPVHTCDDFKGLDSDYGNNNCQCFDEDQLVANDLASANPAAFECQHGWGETCKHCVFTPAQQTEMREMLEYTKKVGVTVDGIRVRSIETPVNQPTRYEVLPSRPVETDDANETAVAEDDTDATFLRSVADRLLEIPDADPRGLFFSRLYDLADRIEGLHVRLDTGRVSFKPTLEVRVASIEERLAALEARGA